MPIFKYRGYGPGGEAVAGALEAEGPRDAALKLKAQGLHPREITAEAGRGRFPTLGRLAEKDRLPSATRQLSVLLRSGVPLVEALRALGEEGKGRWREVLLAVRESVTGGASLSKALEDYPEVFPEFYINMVEAGERSGSLERVLGRMAGFLESQRLMRQKVASAMLYPLFLMCVSSVVLAFLFTFVVPKIVKIFEDTETALPFITLSLIWISNLFVHYWWLMGAGVIGLLYAGKAALSRKRLAIDRALMRAMEELYLSRFARTLSFLLEGGLPVLKALELSGRTSGNSHLAARAKEAAAMVSEGASIRAALSGFPPVLLELVATGEKSGKLSEVLDVAAGGYEAEFDRKVARMLVLLEPTMILVMGLMVGYIVFAVLLPLFQLNQLIK